MDVPLVADSGCSDTVSTHRIAWCLDARLPAHWNTQGNMGTHVPVCCATRCKMGKVFVDTAGRATLDWCSILPRTYHSSSHHDPCVAADWCRFLHLRPKSDSLTPHPDSTLACSDGRSRYHPGAAPEGLSAHSWCDSHSLRPRARRYAHL